MWCIREMDSEFVERMYDVLDLYAEPYNPKCPVIGMDEKPKQLLEDSRATIPMKPGSPEKYDYEYKRNGKANIFLAVEPKAGKRVVEVTERRTKEDFAHYIRDLVDFEYCDAEMLRIVLNNLNTHSEKSLYETFDEKEAERVLQSRGGYGGGLLMLKKSKPILTAWFGTTVLQTLRKFDQNHKGHILFPFPSFYLLFPSFTLALALKPDFPIWAQEKAFKKQPSVKVFSTSDLFSFLSEIGLSFIFFLSPIFSVKKRPPRRPRRSWERKKKKFQS